MSQDAIRAAMGETNRLFEEQVIARRDFAALDRVCTREVRVLPPGAPMATGREAIRAFWKSAVEGLDVPAVRLIPLEVTVLGEDRALEVSRGEIDAGGAAEPVTIKYVVHRRREGGAWLWDVDIWNTPG